MDKIVTINGNANTLGCLVSNGGEGALRYTPTSIAISVLQELDLNGVLTRNALQDDGQAGASKLPLHTLQEAQPGELIVTVP